MKKISVIVLLALCFVLAGCGSDLKTSLVENLSDIRYNIFVGQDEDVNISLMCGMRENPYAYDGISNKKCEFGIITVQTNGQNFESLPYELTVDGAKISGTLEENPFDHTYMIDIEKIISSESAVYITIESLANNMILTCESCSWEVQYDDAIELGIKELFDSTDMFVEDGRLKAETYLKIIYDQKDSESPYYWYFGIVGENGENIAVILDVHTGAVITKSV